MVMGYIEHSAKKSRQRLNIQRAILSTIGIAGILALTMIAPNMFQAIPYLIGRKRYRWMFQTKTAVGRLAAKGYVRFEERDGKKYVRITEEGKRSLAIEHARMTAPARAKKRWDKRYRLVMFDIPQNRKNTRDKLRSFMRDFGFLLVQKSVWLSPYDCEELVALIKTELRLGTSVLYAVVESIENDSWIRKHYHLPSA